LRRAPQATVPGDGLPAYQSALADAVRNAFLTAIFLLLLPAQIPISGAYDSGARMANLQQILDDFAFLEEWEDRYRYVIELGKQLPDLPDSEKTAEHKVQGCASQVWLVSHAGAEGADPVMSFDGDSDAHIVRGLVAIVLAVYSGKHASEIAATDAIEIFDRIGLVEHLSSQRANGLRSMVNRIREEARLRTAA
jgi:cysteine desulfuration protein SufE